MEAPRDDADVRPIDYRYRRATTRPYDDNDEGRSEELSSRRRRYRDDRDAEYYSPKRDLLTRYTSTKMGKVKVKLSSLVLGYAFGVFLFKSVAIFHMKHTSTCLALVFFVLTFLRNAYSDLIQSLALLAILVMSKLREIRKQYPTFPHIKSILRPRTCPRRPFPYAGNPWQYDSNAVEDENAVQFNMMFTVLAMGMAGAMIGGNIPLVPAFIGSPCGGAAFAFGCTLRSAKGDLARSMGMKVVSTCQEVLYIQKELSVVSKSMVVANRILDKLLILDRKHKIKDKVVALVKWIYDKGSGVVQEAQAGIQRRGEESNKKDDDDSGRRRERDYDDRNDGRRRERDYDERSDERRRPPPPAGRDGDERRD